VTDTALLVTMLSARKVPDDVATELVNGLAGMWLLNEPAELLADELACCHPALAPGEVRVAVRPVEAHWRITVVAPDRPGLLAATAGALAGRGLSVETAGLTTWPNRRMAMQGLTVEDPHGRTWSDKGWAEVADDLRNAVVADPKPSAPWRPRGPVKIISSPVMSGRSLVTVEAPDRVGLLHAVASWFRDHGLNVEAATLSGDGSKAVDTFLVEGTASADDLTARLAGRHGSPLAWWQARRR
jgi:[protein-PII] uridylyltransferase